MESWTFSKKSFFLLFCLSSFLLFLPVEADGPPRPSTLSGSNESDIPPSSQMVFLMRHAQAENNLGYIYIRDPSLTDLGRSQSVHMGTRLQAIIAELSSSSPPISPEEILVVSSPLTRSLETTQIAFDTIALAQPVMVYPGIAEVGGDAPCDLGRAKSLLQTLFSPEDGNPANGSVKYDFTSEMHSENWFRPKKRFKALPLEEQIHQLTTHFLTWMAAKKDKFKVFFVMSHWGFINALTRQDLTNAAIKKFILSSQPPHLKKVPLHI